MYLCVFFILLNYQFTSTVIAAGHDNGIVTIWDYSNKDLIQEINSHGKIRSIAFSVEGKYLAVGSESSSIYIYDVENKYSLVKTLKHDNQVVSLKWHHEVPLLLSTSADNSAILWSE